MVVATYAQRALQQAAYNWKVYNGDQNSYLRLALRIRIGEGFANGNFHPLWPMLMSPLASRDWQFFTDAKLANMVLGAAVVLMVFGLGRSLFGSGSALLAAALLAFNPAYVARAARTEPEVLLTGLFLAAWAVWIISVEKPRLAWLAWLAGGLAGLAYLTKGTGHFFVIGFLALPLVWHGRLIGFGQPPTHGWSPLRLPGRWYGRPLLIMVLAYLVAAAPLLWTNWRAFGAPFYAYPSAHAMWYDDWDDRLVAPGTEQATWRTYVATHSLSDAVGRMADGLVEVPPEWLSAFRVQLPPGAAWLWLGMLLAAFAWAGWRRIRAGPPSPPGPACDPNQRAQRLSLALLASVLLLIPMYVFFSWYKPIANSSRFVLPLVPLFYLCAASAVWLALLKMAPPQDRAGLGHWLAGFLVPLAVGAAALLGLAEGSWTSPAHIAAVDRENNAPSMALLDAVARNVPAGATVVWGPGNLATWTLHGQVSFRSVPATVTDLTGLAGYMRQVGARWIVLAPDMVLKRKAVFLPYFEGGKDNVTIVRLPPDWRLIFAEPEGGCRYCLLEVGP